VPANRSPPDFTLMLSIAPPANPLESVPAPPTWNSSKLPKSK
jgi:hypothetical protein